MYLSLLLMILISIYKKIFDIFEVDFVMYAVAYTAYNRLLSITLVINQIRFLSYELIKLHDEMW